MSKITIVGAGVVGTASASGFKTKGHEVTLVDINDERVAYLKAEGFIAVHPRDFILAEEQPDFVFLSVSTPTQDGQINLDYIKLAAEDLGRNLHSIPDGYYPVIVVRSTLPPGTTEDILIPILERESGKKVGIDFGVCYNPEYLRAENENSPAHDFLNPRVTTIGQLPSDQRSADELERLLSPFGGTMYRIYLRAAEFQKYVHNDFNAIKISAFNEFRLVGIAAGIPAEDVEKAFEIAVESAESLWNARYGTRDFGPYGGVCLPKDTQALLHYARVHGIEMPVLAGAHAVNTMFEGVKARLETRGEPHVHAEIRSHAIDVGEDHSGVTTEP